MITPTRSQGFSIRGDALRLMLFAWLMNSSHMACSKGQPVT